MSETPARAEVLRTRDFVGWGVTDANGAKVGTVSDLLIDRGGQVRFLAVDLGLFRKAVLLPVEAMEWGEAALVLPRWTYEEVKALPAYDAGVPLTREVLDELERAHPRYFGTAGPPPPPASGDAPRIVPLRDAKEFKLQKGAPNLRGWTVYGADNERLGTVAEMLVDAVAMKVRYLSVDVDDDLFALKEDRHVAVPLEAAELRERGEDVWLKGLPAREIARLPAYTGGPLDPLLEEAAARAFALGAASSAGTTSSILETAPPPLPPTGGPTVDPLPPSYEAAEPPPPSYDEAAPSGPEGALKPPPAPPGEAPLPPPPAGEPVAEGAPDGRPTAVPPPLP